MAKEDVKDGVVKKSFKLSGDKTPVKIGDEIKLKDIVFEAESDDKFEVDPDTLPVPKSGADAEGMSKQWFNKANAERDPDRKSAYLAVSKKYLSIASKMDSEKTLGDGKKKDSDE